MSINNRFVSAREFVRDWATEHGHPGLRDAHIAPTTDHKLIVTAVGLPDWLELPGDPAGEPISRFERKQITGWLLEKSR